MSFREAMAESKMKWLFRESYREVETEREFE
jgi:hypothetical protein